MNRKVYVKIKMQHNTKKNNSIIYLHACPYIIEYISVSQPVYEDGRRVVSRKVSAEDDGLHGDAVHAEHHKAELCVPGGEDQNYLAAILLSNDLSCILFLCYV